MLHYIVIDNVNLTISLLDRPIVAEFTNGVFHEDVTYQHPLSVNNSNNNHYFPNYPTNNRSVSPNHQLNSKTNHFINNSINDGDLPNSETAPLIYLINTKVVFLVHVLAFSLVYTMQLGCNSVACNHACRIE